MLLHYLGKLKKSEICNCHARNTRLKCDFLSSIQQIREMPTVVKISAKINTMQNVTFTFCFLFVHWQPGKCLYTRYNRLSNLLSNGLSNRLDNRLYGVYKHSTGCQTRLTTSLTNGCIVYTAGCQTGCTTRFDNRFERTTTVHSTRLSNRLYNRIDNRLYRVNGVL